MPKLPLRLTTLVQPLTQSLWLAEPLLFGELSQLGERPDSLVERLHKRVAKMAAELTPEELAGRRLAEPPQIAQAAVRVEPPRRSVAWQTPLELAVPYVWWRRGDVLVGYVPALTLYVVGENDHDFPRQVAVEIRSCLSREGISTDLARLSRLADRIELGVRSSQIEIEVPTPKARQLKLDALLDKKSSVLKEVATNLAREPLAPAFERDELVRQLAEHLSAQPPRSVLLVGPSGVGKTAIFHELVRQRRKLRFGKTPFWATSGPRLVAGMSGFGMWQDRCDRLVREAAKTRAIVHLGNLADLLEVGKAVSQQQSIGGFLRPAIARGQLLSVAECTAEQLPAIERGDPQLLNSFVRLNVDEPSPNSLRSILLSAAVTPPILPRPDKRRDQKRPVRRPPPRPWPPVEPEALDALDRLHRRFATYSAFPGRPLRFLRNLLEERTASVEPNKPVTQADVTAAFSRETGLPLFLIDERQRLDLAEAHGWFSRRVMGQPDAIRLVVDLLATIKAELTRPGRPIASLLFVGPTGVGKTETAKALAEYLFQDAGRLTRFDMSEYADFASVDRLIGGLGTAEGLLTRSIREQPFQVLLLDEFEKAHGRFFDLLLQVLGEGRLTDAAGRMADFRNAIVILTSNLGAEGFKETSLGFGGPTAPRAAVDYFVNQAREFLRPEAFNRLDAIVPFRPLSGESLATIARRECEQILLRDGIRYRDLAVGWDAAVIETLAREGNHPRLGARPLKRALERRVVAPLAEGLNRYDGGLSLSAQLTLAEGQVRVLLRSNEAGRSEQVAQERCELDLLTQWAVLRRDAQRLAGGPKVLALRNEIVRREQLAKRNTGREQPWQIQRALAEIEPLKQLVGRVEAILARTSQTEDQSLFDYYRGRPLAAAELTADLALERAEFDDLLLSLLLLDASRKSRVTLLLYSQSKRRLGDLGWGYEALFSRRKWTVQRYHLRIYRKEFDAEVTPAATIAKQPGDSRPAMHLKNRRASEDDAQEKIVDAFAAITAHDCWDFLGDAILGVALQIHGELAFPMIEPEQGAHVFRNKGKNETVLAETFADLLTKYEPPAAVARQALFKDLPLRRTYDAGEHKAHDELLKRDLEWTGGSGLGDVIATAAEQGLLTKAREALDA